MNALSPCNALTYASLASAMAAIAMARNGSAPAAGACLALAALADTFDGRFARRFTRSPEMQALGAQLDSLSDGVAFGVAPVMAMTMLLPAMTGLTSVLWWAAAIVYAACTVTRLALFNVTATTSDNDGFIGIPAPVAALIWSTIFLGPVDVRVAIAIAVLAGMAMVSPWRIARPHGKGLLLFAMWPLSLVVAHVLRA
jgi:phosphatidylserine synthase